MRRIAPFVLAAVALAACSTESTAPTPPASTTLEAGAFGTALTLAGGYDADLYKGRLTNGLPDSLKLSADQEAKIKALVDAFKASTKADAEALAALLKDARGALQNKTKTPESAAILAKAAEITGRLAIAQAKLKSDIDAVLTPEQRAWLEAHAPKKCDPIKFSALTDAQKAQIQALEKAFEDANAADLAAVKAAYQQGEGKSKAELAVILKDVQPAIARLEAARKALLDSITNVLTPEQRASGCLPLG